MSNSIDSESERILRKAEQHWPDAAEIVLSVHRHIVRGTNRAECDYEDCYLTVSSHSLNKMFPGPSLGEIEKRLDKYIERENLTTPEKLVKHYEKNGLIPKSTAFGPAPLISTWDNHTYREDEMSDTNIEPCSDCCDWLNQWGRVTKLLDVPWESSAARVCEEIRKLQNAVFAERNTGL